MTWRRVQFEVSPDEAGVSDEQETIESPPLGGFGLPDPDPLVGIAMRFQIAQKLHAVSAPHKPPDSINDRARDIVDLLLLRDLAASTGSPALPEVNAWITEIELIGLPDEVAAEDERVRHDLAGI